MSRNTKADGPTSVWLTSQMRQALAELAARLGLRQSAIIRMAVCELHNEIAGKQPATAEPVLAS